MSKPFRSPFRYEMDDDDPDGLITIRDLDSKFVCNTNDEDKAQIIVESLEHFIINEE